MARCLYRHDARIEPSIFPLEIALGIEAKNATPMFAEQVGVLSVHHEESMVLTFLRQTHGVAWGKKTLRNVVASLSAGLASCQIEAQKQKLLEALAAAAKAGGRRRFTLVVGRDGVMVPIRKEKYKEAGAATVSVYDGSGRRCHTVYLGQMPEENQAELSRQLTELIQSVLQDWQGQEPRLLYITDAGKAQRAYFRNVLRKMTHPRDAQRVLSWTWTVDYWHACQYVMKLANGLFGTDTPAARTWYGRMRRWLRDRRRGLANVLQSAGQHQGQRTKTAKERKEYGEAYRYLRRHARHMRYSRNRASGQPIGSGVTEAACKTVFSERLKRSGMTWERPGGQRIVNLRILFLSGVWATVNEWYHGGKGKLVSYAKTGSSRTHPSRTSSKAA